MIFVPIADSPPYDEGIYLFRQESEIDEIPNQPIPCLFRWVGERLVCVNLSEEMTVADFPDGDWSEEIKFSYRHDS